MRSTTPSGARRSCGGSATGRVFRYQKYRETWTPPRPGDRGRRDADRRLPRDRGRRGGHPRGGRGAGLRAAPTTSPSPTSASSSPAAARGTWSSRAVKAMVLAAGLGLRMRPLTLLRAKPALPVLNRPLLALDARAAGRAPACATWSSTSTTCPRRSRRRSATAGASACGSATSRRAARSSAPAAGRARVREFFGDEPCLLVNGDVLFDFDLRALVARHRASGARATLALRPQPRPARLLAGGDATASGRILSIAGRPAPRTRARSRCSRASTCSTRRSSSGCPTGASDSVRDLYIPLLAEGAPLHGRARRGARGTISAARRSTATRSCGCCGPRRAASLVEPEARVAAAPRGRAARWSARGARVAAGAAVEASVLWEGAVVEAGARVSRSIVTAGAVVRAASGRRA